MTAKDELSLKSKLQDAMIDKLAGLITSKFVERYESHLDYCELIRDDIKYMVSVNDADEAQKSRERLKERQSSYQSDMSKLQILFNKALKEMEQLFT